MPRLAAHLQVKRRRPRARRILLHTATDQTVRLVQRDLAGGKALVHVVTEVLLPLRDPAQHAAKAAKRRKRCVTQGWPGEAVQAADGYWYGSRWSRPLVCVC